ncbi:longitudinals lacking protein, isoforms N/O/W/X/Y-like [Rhodnius prolixus]|uniref:longitudinals lacking protein, isoforms N/O/W/X/Y-like n=1 Tax=Rhodnius prolixus TaxID=13249 RepID=UPI003D18D014
MTSFICVICKDCIICKAFDSIKKWQGDEETVSLRFTCSVCNKSYANKQNLNRHKRYECGKEPQFQCPYCCYKTKHRGSLRTHVGIKHAGEEENRISRNYCGVCGKSYVNKGDLNRHKKYECGKEPQFQCPYCSHRTRYRTSLKTHIGIKHGGIV